MWSYRYEVRDGAQRVGAEVGAVDEVCDGAQRVEWVASGSEREQARAQRARIFSASGASALSLDAEPVRAQRVLAGVIFSYAKARLTSLAERE